MIPSTLHGSTKRYQICVPLSLALHRRIKNQTLTTAPIGAVILFDLKQKPRNQRGAFALHETVGLVIPAENDLGDLVGRDHRSCDDEYEEDGL